MYPVVEGFDGLEDDSAQIHCGELYALRFFLEGNMKACVFVDGENFRFSINDLFKAEFKKEDYLPKQADWSGFFHYVVLMAGARTLIRTYWYVVENIDFWPYNLNKMPDNELFQILSRDKSIKKKLDAEPDRIKKSEIAKDVVGELTKKINNMQARFNGWKEIPKNRFL